MRPVQEGSARKEESKPRWHTPIILATWRLRQEKHSEAGKH